MSRLIRLAALLLLTACARPEPGCTALPGGARYCLQPTAAAPAFAVRQQISARFGDKREMLIADIENQADRLDFVGLTPFGLTVFQASYNNHAATAVRLPDPRLSPELLLGMLQLGLWPAASVQQGLGPGTQVIDTADMRRVLIGDIVLMELRHDGSPPPHRRMQIDFPALDLRLDIRTLEDTP